MVWACPAPAGRHGAIAFGLVFLGLVVAAAVVVMAVGGQADSVRSVHAAVTLGREASELVESALDECMADLPAELTRRLSGRDMRAHLLARGAGGLVAGPDVLGVDSFTYIPRRTLDLVATNHLPIEIGDVLVRPLHYGLVQNSGEVEISAHASYRLPGGRRLYRRITARHPIVLDADGRTLRPSPVPASVIADRSQDA